MKKSYFCLIAFYFLFFSFYLDIFPKKKIKRRWSKEEESYLRKTFKFYLQGTRSSVHNKDLLMAQDCCAALSTRTLAQIRTKLNNMKLGK